MARDTGPSCKICRREGGKLFLRGKRCFTQKCAFLRRGFRPGMHGRDGRRRLTAYGVQLREKQKMKAIYGVLERQFRHCFALAEKKGNPGQELLFLLERRLDNVLYHLGVADSRAMARQFVNHGHVTVNGKKVDICSYTVRVNDEISLKEVARKNPFVVESLEGKDVSTIPAWLVFEPEKFVGKVVRLPKREDVTIPIQEQLIVDLYSK